MKPRHTLKKLKIWNDAIELAVVIYKMTEMFPKHEKFNLVSQMNRAAVSISSNIAEGAGRNHDKEFKQFIGIANGSANELLSQLTIAFKLGYISEDGLNDISFRIEKNQNNMFNFVKTLENNGQSASRTSRTSFSS